jgi:hypothetical protein
MSVLYAAAVSVVVTLTIEWFAKPWLESHKEHKLEQDRALRAVINLARTYTWRIEQRLLRNPSATTIPDHRAEFVQVRSTIDMPRDFQKATALAHLTQVMEGEGSREPQIHHAILLAAVRVLETPRLSPKRRRVVAEFHQIAVATAKPGFSVEYQVGRNRNQASRK